MTGTNITDHELQTSYDYNFDPYDYDYDSSNENFSTFLVPTKVELPDAHPAMKILLASVYISMMLICGIGNLLLCCVIVAYRRMRTTTNILIGNLALSDFFTAVLCVPFNFHYYTTSEWPYGQAICKTVNYVKCASLYVSTISLLVMALDRYVIIMNPLRPRMTRLCTIIIISFVWVFSFCLAIPTLINTETVDFYTNDGDKRQCFILWGNKDHLRIYTIVLLIVAFIFPLVTMAVVYTRIALKLWFRKIPGNQCTAQQAAASEQSKKRSVRMLIILVLAFAICWGPYYCFNFLRDVMFMFDHADSSTISCYFIVECLAMSNCVIDTVTYVILNPNCRKHGRMLLASIFPKYFAKPSIVSVQGMQLTRRATTSSVTRITSTGNRTPRSSITYQPVSKRERMSAASTLKEDMDSN